MAPNPRATKAFRAMRDLGLPDEKTKPVLKSLLKIYGKNWELIEAENYRALADAIFEQDEVQVAEKRKLENNDVNTLEAEAFEDDETERPLKRLRLNHQDNYGSASTNNTNPSTAGSKLPEGGPSTQDLGSGSHSPLTRNKGKQSLLIHEQSEASQKVASDRSQQLVISGTGSDSISPTVPNMNKRKAPLTTETVSKDTNTALQKSSHAFCFKEPKPEPVTESSAEKRLSTTLAMIKPKDEPITDCMPQTNHPISEANPDTLDKEVSPREVHTVRGVNCPVENHNDGHILSNKKKTNEKTTNIGDCPSTGIQLAASPCGDVKISLTCNSATGRSDFHMPSIDAVLKMVEDKCLGSYKITDPSFSLTNVLRDTCEYFLKLGADSGNVSQASGLLKHSDTVGGSEKPIDPIPLNVSVDSGTGTNIDDEDQHTGNMTANNGIANEENGSENMDMQIEKVYDIAKGHEKVVITLVNDVNDERPPSFHYIPKNAVYQNAYINFSLARIGDNTSCAVCSGNCLSSSSSHACPCVNDTNSTYAYTIDGLVKEDLLKECITMNRNPKKNFQYYCKKCPLERLKNEEEILEPCKGHLVRKFIKECWWKCGCNMRKCGNRVVQHGITINLQVFMTPGGKGWGLRTLQALPKGTFVCEYVGEILTNAELYDRVSAKRDGEAHSYPVLLDADWGAEGVLKDEKALCLDATYYGNIARFINHRCFDANMVEIPVEVETPDHHYYHPAFFTTRKVQAMEELTRDYGIDFDDHEHPIKAFKCQCGSTFCRDIKRNTRSRSRR